MNDLFFVQMDLGAFAVGPVEYDAESNGDNEHITPVSPPSPSSESATIEQRRWTSSRSPSREHERHRSRDSSGIIDFLFKRRASHQYDVSPHSAFNGATTPNLLSSHPSPLRRGSVGNVLPIAHSASNNGAPTFVSASGVTRPSTLNTTPTRIRSKSNDPKLVEQWNSMVTTSTAGTATNGFQSQLVAPRNIDRRTGTAAALCRRRKGVAIIAGNNVGPGGTVSMNGTAAVATGYRRFSVSSETRTRSPSVGSATSATARTPDSGEMSTPMSRLLTGSDIAMNEPSTGAPQSGTKAILPGPSTSFGVDEFMLLFRKRAYSADLRNDRAMATVRARHHHTRTQSDVSVLKDAVGTDTITSATADSSDGAENCVNGTDRNGLAPDDDLPSPASLVISGRSSAHVSTVDKGGGVDSVALTSRLLHLSTVAAQGVPDTIMEHKEYKFDDGLRRHSLYELSDNIVRAARIRRYGRSNITEEADGSSSSNTRRLSTPLKTNLHLLAVRNSAAKAVSPQVSTSPMPSLTKVMSNFPKYFTGEEYDPSNSTNSSGIDIRQPKRHLILWRDRVNGTRIIPLTADGESYDSSDAVAGDVKQTFVNLLKNHQCYDLMPNHSKIVSFDVRLELICAFDGLLFNGVKAAPLWDDVQFRFIGMLTITDFVRILHNSYYHCPMLSYSLNQDNVPPQYSERARYTVEQLNLLDQHNIRKWRELLKDDFKELITITAVQSLYDAALCLHDNNIRRLLVLNPDSENAPLYVLTNKRLLHFMYLMIKERKFPEFMYESISDLGVGTYENISTITMDTRLIDALTLFVEHRVSALPVVDDDGKLVNAFAKYDTVNLVTSELYKNLNCTIQKALEAQDLGSEGVYLCKKTDSLADVIRWLVTKDLHRLWIVNESNCLEGIVSLSDVMTYLVIRPGQLATEDSLIDQALDDDLSCQTDDNNTNNDDNDEISDVEDFEDLAVTSTTLPHNDDPSIGYGQSTPKLTLEEAIKAGDEEDTSSTCDELPLIIVTDYVDSIVCSADDAVVQRDAMLGGCDHPSAESIEEVVEQSNEEADSRRENATSTPEDRVQVVQDNGEDVDDSSVDLRLPNHYANCDEGASMDSGEDSGSGVGSSVTDEEDVDNDIDCSGSQMKIRATLTPGDAVTSGTVAETVGCKLMTSAGKPSPRGIMRSNESAYTSSCGLYDEDDSEDDEQVET